jgi:hypothetical protein
MIKEAACLSKQLSYPCFVWLCQPVELYEINVQPATAPTMLMLQPFLSPYPGLDFLRN